MRGSSDEGSGTSTGGRAGKWRVAVMHGPVDGEVSRSSRIPPSIAATLARPVEPAAFYLRIFVYASSLNPTRSVRPTLSVGARSTAGGAQEERQELDPSRPRSLEVDLDHLLALGDVDLVDVAGDRQGGVTDDGRFLGVDRLDDRDLLLRKEPLRFGAGGSALPVITPVYACHGRYLYHRGVHPKYWLPPLLWMAVIVGFSTDAGSESHTEHWLLPILRELAPWATPALLEALHWLVRKSAHLSEYAILAALWLRAFVRGRNLSPRTAGFLALAISVAWAILDELHQSFVPSRTASLADVLVDSAGALIALTVAHVGWRQAVDRTTTALLWIALIGGAGFLLVNTILGVRSGPLWLTAPTAALALVVRTKLARQRSRSR